MMNNIVPTFESLSPDIDIVDAISPEVKKTFYRVEYGFAAETRHPFVPDPVNVIAGIAIARVAEVSQLDLQFDIDEEHMTSVYILSGSVGQITPLEDIQASEFAQIGERLLKLNEQGGINPPLDELEKQSIGHLIREVGRTASHKY